MLFKDLLNYVTGVYKYLKAAGHCWLLTTPDSRWHGQVDAQRPGTVTRALPEGPWAPLIFLTFLPLPPAVSLAIHRTRELR